MFKISITFMDNSRETYEQEDTYAITPAFLLLKPIHVGNGVCFGLSIPAHRVKFVNQEYVPDEKHVDTHPSALPN